MFQKVLIVIKQRTENRRQKSDITKSIEVFLTSLRGVDPYGPEADIGRLTSGRGGQRLKEFGGMMSIKLLSQDTIPWNLSMKEYIPHARGYDREGAVFQKS